GHRRPAGGVVDPHGEVEDQAAGRSAVVPGVRAGARVVGELDDLDIAGEAEPVGREEVTRDCLLGIECLAVDQAVHLVRTGRSGVELGACAAAGDYEGEATGEK